MDDYEDFERKYLEWSNNLSHSKMENILDKDSTTHLSLEGQHILVITLCIISTITNTVILTTIVHIRRRLTANQTIMFSLCCSDLLTSIAMLASVISTQLYDRHKVPAEKRPGAICLYKLIQSIIFVGHNSTLCNLLCLAVDHYCAIAKPLMHSVYMSKSRVHIILVSLWILSILFGFSDFLIPAPPHEYCKGSYSNYCERVYCSKYEPDHIMFCVVAVCCVVMTGAYGCIMWTLYRYQRQRYVTVLQRKAQRHIRGLLTSFIILGIFAVLWLPSCIMDAYTIIRMTMDDITVHKLHKQVFWYLYALTILNAICDPIIYAMRMREIQESLKLLLCFKRQTFSNKRNAFGDYLKYQNSTGSQTGRYILRQTSSISTNTTECSPGLANGSQRERQPHSRKGTISSQTSDINEETAPLHTETSFTINRRETVTEELI